MKKRFSHIALLLINALPLTANAADVSTFADLLYWHVSEETSSNWSNIITPPNTGAMDYTAANIVFDWDFGFRAGFTYEPTAHLWDSRLYWTNFSSGKSLGVSPTGQVITSEFFSGFVSGDIFFNADFNWHIILNMIDYDASHEFKVGECLTLRPSIGIKAATVNQRLTAEWDAEILTSAETVKHNYYGIGPTFGLEGKWNVCNTLFLIGNFSTAYMLGDWKIKDTYTRPSALLGFIPPTTITTSTSDMMLGTLLLDYFVGLEWTYEGRNNLTFQLGYEMLFWSNQLRMPSFQQLPVHGDLTLQGGTCRIQIDL